jgi:hypothetical protein
LGASAGDPVVLRGRVALGWRRSTTLRACRRAAEIAFAEKVRRLRWSSHKLTYYIQGLAEEERANVELTVPDICTEVKAIAEAGYQTVPAVRPATMAAQSGTRKVVTRQTSRVKRQLEYKKTRCRVA